MIGDLISPFKAAIGLDYKAFEARLLEAIHRRFGLPPSLPERITMAIKMADRVAAYYEATAAGGLHARRRPTAISACRAACPSRCASGWRRSMPCRSPRPRRQFLARFEELSRDLSQE